MERVTKNGGGSFVAKMDGLDEFMRTIEAQLATEATSSTSSSSTTAASATSTAATRCGERSAAKRRRRNAPPQQREEEIEALQRGLGSALTSSNVGFRMLAKMGYKPGGGLGAPGREGIRDPIDIGMVVGQKRAAGLGRAALEAAAAERASAAVTAARAEAMRRAGMEQRTFVSAQRVKALRRRLCVRLRKSRSVVRTLDERSRIGWHALWGGCDPDADVDDDRGDRVDTQRQTGGDDVVEDMAAVALEAAIQESALYLMRQHEHCIEWDSDFGE